MKVKFEEDELKFLSDANRIQARAIRGRLLAPHIEKIEQEAKEKYPDRPNQEAEETKQILEDRKKYIAKEKDELVKDLGKQIRGLKGGGTRTIIEGKLGQIKSVIKPLLDMNIYIGGALVDYNDLVKIRLANRTNVDIRNPDISLLEDENLKTAIRASSQNDKLKILAENYDTVISLLEDNMQQDSGEIIEVKNFPVRKFLGVADVSKKTTRIAVYDFWNSVVGKFDEFKTNTEELFDNFEKLNLPDEAMDTLEDILKINLDELQYVAYFPKVDKRFTNRRQKFWNILFNIMVAEDLFDKDAMEERYEDDPASFSDVNQELTSELTSSISSGGDGGGQTLSGESLGRYKTETNQGFEYKGEVQSIRGIADPLLIYEDNTNNKLVAISEQAELELLDLLEEIEKSLSSRESMDGGVVALSINTQYDLKRWVSEVEDTTVIEQEDLDNNEANISIESYALPISVMSNNYFAESYTGDSFEAANDTKISLDNLDKIKNFFEDLYKILSDDIFREEVGVRSSTGMRGSVIDRRERGSFQVAEFPVPLQRGGQIREEIMQGVADSLKKMMESAVEYFFNPLYAGYLPISMPTFGSSIGTKVFQLLSLDLGVETVLSESLEMSFEGTLEEATADNLANIADFLDNIFDSGVKIDRILITDGEQAAGALTDIFGKEEQNNNYCAAIIYHFAKESMEEEELEKFGKKKFNRKTLKERSMEFYKQHGQRKPFPVFALPYWLDKNQGALTKDNTKRKHYNRLKDLFESVQVDLPVLLHKMLKAHDIIRQQLGKEVVHGRAVFNSKGITGLISKMQVEQQVDLSVHEVEKIVLGEDSHANISKEYGISADQVYLIKAEFR